MPLRLRLFSKFVLWSTWTFFEVFLAVAGNLQTISALYPQHNEWFWKYAMNEPIKSILDWFSINWGYGFLLVMSYAVFDGFYKKTKKYLGERVEVDLRFEEFAQNTNSIPHLSFKIINHELFDIENCYGTLLELENLYTPTNTIPILETVNPNNKFLSWGGGSISERVTIPRSDGVHHGVKILNIAKGGADVVFVFHGHELNFHGANFRAKIKIDGEVDGTPIQSIGAEFCFKYGVNHYTTRQREPEIGEKQKITIVVTDIKSRFAFEDCDKIWETPVINTENDKPAT
jgi:hypothetical protein